LGAGTTLAPKKDNQKEVFVKEVSLSESSAAVSWVPFPYDISFADCASSEATRMKIEEQMLRLARVYDRIQDVKVVVRIPHRHGSLRQFHINIQVDVPGKRIAVSRDPEVGDDHMDIGMAIRDSFTKAVRQLECFAKLKRGHREH
jgi:hypothetical protein